MSGLKSPLPYHVFEQKLRDRDEGLLRLFPGLKENEKGKTVDELFVLFLLFRCFTCSSEVPHPKMERGNRSGKQNILKTKGRHFCVQVSESKLCAIYILMYSEGGDCEVR